MLGQQYFTNQRYTPYLQEHFIVMTIDLDEKPGGTLADQYKVVWFPSTLIIKADGSLYDIIRGYDNNPDHYHAHVKDVVSGDASFVIINKKHYDAPENIQYHFDLAWKQLDMIYLDEAELTLKNVEKQLTAKGETQIKLDEFEVPGLEAVSFAYGILKYRGGRNPNGLLEFTSTYPRSALRLRADTNLADAFARRAQHKSAEAFFVGVRQQYPDNENMMFNCVRYAVATGKALAETEPIVISLLAKYPDNEGVLKSATGFYLKKNDLPKAYQYYGPTFAENIMDNAAALNAYAWYWAERSLNLDSAEETAKRSIELDNLANTWDSLSMVYWKMKKYQKAIDAEEEAVKLDDKPAFREQIKKIKADMNR
ncbi:hypothetical protein KAR48_14955 [bacterium]|nr:hypothetical protein [bacterium]